VAVASGTC